jgi:hypothetical protein
MATASSRSATVDRVTNKPIYVRAGVAAVVAVLLNLLVLAVALVLDVAPGFRPLAVGPIVFLTVVGVAGAAVVYAFLDRRTENAHALFRRVAIGVLLVSFLPDVGLFFGDPAATVLGVLALVVMHVAAAATCIALIPGTAPDPGTAPEPAV